MKKMASLKGAAAALAITSAMVASVFTASSASAQLMPAGLELVKWQGGWQRGGSDPVQACLSHINSQFPGANVQIIDTDEEARWTGWHGRDRQYRYGCTAIVKPLR